MAFVTLVDFSGTVEAIFFADTLEKLGSIVQKDAALVVSGRCSTRENEAVKIIAENAQPIESARTQLTQGIEITITREGSKPDLAERIERLCMQHPGTVPLYIRLSGGNGVDHRYVAENFQLRIGDHLVNHLEKLVGEGNVRLISGGIHDSQKSNSR